MFVCLVLFIVLPPVLVAAALQLGLTLAEGAALTAIGLAVIPVAVVGAMIAWQSASDRFARRPSLARLAR